MKAANQTTRKSAARRYAWLVSTANLIVSNSLIEIGRDPTGVLERADSNEFARIFDAETDAARELGMLVRPPLLSDANSSGATTDWRMRSVFNGTGD
jgi:hypothetical protein